MTVLERVLDLLRGANDGHNIEYFEAEVTKVLTESTCSTCRFMGATGGADIWDPGYDNGDGYGGTQGGDIHETDHHPCARIIHGNRMAEGDTYTTVNAEPAIVTDGSGYTARLRVLPTFGCRLHEPKT